MGKIESALDKIIPRFRDLAADVVQLKKDRLNALAQPPTIANDLTIAQIVASEETTAPDVTTHLPKTDRVLPALEEERTLSSRDRGEQGVKHPLPQETSESLRKELSHDLEQYTTPYTDQSEEMQGHAQAADDNSEENPENNMAEVHAKPAIIDFDEIAQKATIKAFEASGGQYADTEQGGTNRYVIRLIHLKEAFEEFIETQQQPFSAAIAHLELDGDGFRLL